ncbi:MAG: GxxExxY protein [Chitinophagales bacterium]
MIKEEYKYSDITQRIIGCAMRVHSALGCGFPEIIYHRAMIIEMKDDGLNFESEKEVTVYYKIQVIGKRRVDFFVEDVVSVEIKAISELNDSNLNQGLNYLEAFKIEIGLLLNFGAKTLQFKRLINSKKSA